MLKSSLRFALLLAVPAFLGCGEKSSPNTSKEVVTAPPPGTVDAHAGHDHGDDHGHEHPSHGPHEGELIELGSEEYHAELIHDDKSVTIYLLDSSAKKAVPIDAKELVVNLLHDGKPEQFKLAASREKGDPEGKSSKFVSSDAELAEHIDDKAAEAKLVVNINGKSYRASLAHDHEHAGHLH